MGEFLGRRRRRRRRRRRHLEQDQVPKITNSCDEFVILTIPEPSRLDSDYKITNSCDEFVMLTIAEQLNQHDWCSSISQFKTESTRLVFQYFSDQN